MFSWKLILKNLRVETDEIGYRLALQYLIYYFFNKFITARHLDVVCLTQEKLVPLDSNKYAQYSSRLANESDLLKMHNEPQWDLSADLLTAFNHGDRCLLSFKDNQLAGYAWVHLEGQPELLPGLHLSLPDNYLYNYATFTLPEFRGAGLQTYRHHELLNRPEWKNKSGMIGYVDYANWRSKKGQAKSGYQRLGSLTMLGIKKYFICLASSELKKLGIDRLRLKNLYKNSYTEKNEKAV
jgi:hypothetical protein